jgi:spore maturation protein SpmA
MEAHILLAATTTVSVIPAVIVAVTTAIAAPTTVAATTIAATTTTISIGSCRFQTTLRCSWDRNRRCRRDLADLDLALVSP